MLLPLNKIEDKRRVKILMANVTIMQNFVRKYTYNLVSFPNTRNTRHFPLGSAQLLATASITRGYGSEAVRHMTLNFFFPFSFPNIYEESVGDPC